MIPSRTARYFSVLGELPLKTAVSDQNGRPLSFARTLESLGARARHTHAQGNKLMFIGNGGSAGICSHMAIDYSKNGGIRSLAFNDGAALTCLGNDLGYENVFARQIELHAQLGDMLIAISSSGQSANILKAVAVAAERGCYVVTLSGFKATNKLRRCGDVNLYVNSSEYGFVEITHLALIHAVLDLEMGWGTKGVTPEEEQAGLDAHATIA